MTKREERSKGQREAEVEGEKGGRERNRERAKQSLALVMHEVDL